MKTAQRLVPELRFPGFEGEWVGCKLGEETSKIGSGLTPTGGSSVYKKSGILFIRSQNVNNDRLLLEDPTYISEALHKRMKNSTVEANDILLNITGASIGRSCVLPDDFTSGNVNQHVCIIRLKKNHTSKFMQAMLSSPWGKKLIFNSQAGGGREGLNFQNIRLFKINLPPLPEQQKIAAFLSGVDKKIENLSRKKELLQTYKKGVMQKIFSREIRFKDDDGKDFPDWEEKRLGEVLINYRLGGNYSNSEMKNENPLIKMGNINRGKININKIEYISEEEIINPIDEIKFNDLFFNTRNTLELVGKVAIWKNELPKAYYNSNLMFMKFANNPFMNYRFNSYDVTKLLRRLATGTTSVAAIYTKDLLKSQFDFPSLPEQQKIASFLSNIDKKIETVDNQLTKMQTFKKGLLQKMFV